MIQIQVKAISTKTRPAHFSHFSREREMLLRDISLEKCGARNFWPIWTPIWPKLKQFLRQKYFYHLVESNTPFVSNVFWTFITSNHLSHIKFFQHMIMLLKIVVYDRNRIFGRNFRPKVSANPPNIRPCKKGGKLGKIQVF